LLIKYLDNFFTLYRIYILIYYDLIQLEYILIFIRFCILTRARVRGSVLVNFRFISGRILARIGRKCARREWKITGCFWLGARGWWLLARCARGGICAQLGRGIVRAIGAFGRLLILGAARFLVGC
jgi:hypothetical protein